jgi:putative ABC transport system permease protein
MKFAEIIETIRISFEAMKANKMRSFLASMGVVVGISIVILMGWVLGGLDSAMMDTFNILGTDMLYVDKWDWAGGKSWKEVRQRKPITLEQVNQFSNKIKSADVAFPSAVNWMGGTIKYNNKSLENIQIMGTTSMHGSTSGGAILMGRHFSLFDDEIAPNVVVLGHGVYKSMFNDDNPLDKTIKIDGHKYRIIGVIKKQGTMLLDFIDNRAYIPLKRFIGTYGKYDRSFSINIKAGSEDMLPEVYAETRGLMREIRNIGPYDEDDFSINSVKAFEDQVAKIRLYVWGVGIGITVLSFIVGIIGIMNIMFVSVTERTKEIGIRKAIGARKRSILLQFLVESSTLCFMGALISLAGCSLLVFLAATYIPTIWEGWAFLKPYLPMELLLIATIVSVIVGMLAGLIPALRAANLNPVDALRYE